MNVLILTTEFLPQIAPSANCIYEVINVVVLKDIKVSLICPRRLGKKSFEVIDNIEVYRIKASLLNNLDEKCENIKKVSIRVRVKSLLELLAHLRLLMFFPFFPAPQIGLIIRYYFLAKRIVDIKDIDLCISTLNSLESVLASTLLKKIKKVKNNIVYMLDTLSNRGTGRF